MNKDNNDIIDVLPAGEESDMASHYTLISSLEEHSYCASIMSTSSSVAQEYVIGDLFGNSAELCNDDMDTSIRFPIGIGDVNLDGFNYSVPASGGSSESMELENMWVGLNSDTSTTTVVEVAATNDDDLQQPVVVRNTDMNMTDGAAGAADKANQSHGAKDVPKPKFRRTDFIADTKKRKSHFDLYFRKLSSDFLRVLSRTGCEGNLSSLFEGKFYDGRSLREKTVTATTSSQSSNGGSLLPHPVFVSDNASSLISDGMDDHRYAATMITQNVASSDIRDHQYDEKTVASALDSDTTDNDEDSYRFKKREHSKRYRYDYIKVRWERTQIFAKLVRSLFTSRKLLEQRTGAEIQLTLEFEGITFNGENFLNASKIIAAHRKHLQSRRSILAPKIHHTTTPTPLTFFLPNFNSFPFQVPYVIPVSSASSVVSSCENFPLTVSVSSAIIPNVSLSNADAGTTFNVANNFNEIQPDVTNENLDTDEYIPTLSLVESNNVTACVVNGPNDKEKLGLIQEISSIGPCVGLSNSAIAAGAAQDIDEQFLALDNSSMQNSPEVTVARGVRESATNTEPICSICFNASKNSNSSARANEEDCATKSFWIRCNDPFCYDMVHAACVGFVITHNIHLKQLPAYYCKSHR